MDNNAIILDLTSVGNKSEYLEFPFELLDEEKDRLFKDVKSIDEIYVSGYLLGASNIYNLKLMIQGQATLLDDKKIDLENDVDIVIDLKDINNSELIPLDDGKYDLRGEILALLYDSIAKNTVSHDENSFYSIVYQDEDEKEINNPFSIL